MGDGRVFMMHLIGLSLNRGHLPMNREDVPSGAAASSSVSRGEHGELAMARHRSLVACSDAGGWAWAVRMVPTTAGLRLSAVEIPRLVFG